MSPLYQKITPAPNGDGKPSASCIGGGFSVCKKTQKLNKQHSIILYLPAAGREC